MGETITSVLHPALRIGVRRVYCTDLAGNRRAAKISPHDGHWGNWCDADCPKDAFCFWGSCMPGKC